MECNGFCEDSTWFQGMCYLIDFIDTLRTVQDFLCVEDGGKGEGVFKLTISKLYPIKKAIFVLAIAHVPFLF